MLLTALPPPPPTPMTVSFGRISDISDFLEALIISVSCTASPARIAPL
jgi:hypothetical protein